MLRTIINWIRSIREPDGVAIVVASDPWEAVRKSGFRVGEPFPLSGVKVREIMAEQVGDNRFLVTVKCTKALEEAE